MKYKIEKNTVQETLILPLYSRKLCTELYPNLYRDETAVRPGKDSGIVLSRPSAHTAE